MHAYTNAPQRALILCAPREVTFDFKPVVSSVPTSLHGAETITQLFANGNVNGLRDFVSLLRHLGYTVYTE